MSKVFNSIALALWSLSMVSACASVMPANPTPDVSMDHGKDVDVVGDEGPAMDRAESSDASRDSEASDGTEVGDESFDATFDAPEVTPPDAPSDASGDWPVVVLVNTTGRECNALRIHGIVNTLRHAGPFSETLARGVMRDGVYHLTQSEHFPNPSAPDLIYGVFGMTMRVVGTQVEFGRTQDVNTLVPTSGLRRYNCLLNVRGGPFEQCFFTCPDSKRALGFSPFFDYEATPDQVRIWENPYLLTFRWMGPP